MIASFWKRRARARLRNAMRGYRRLRDAGRLGRVDDACATLVTTPFDIRPDQLSERFFGTAVDRPELATRQYLYMRQVAYKLPQVLLEQFGSTGSAVAHPLPREWQNILSELGFKIDKRRSSLLWTFWQVVYWGYGVVGIIKLLVQTAIGSRGNYAGVGHFSHFEYIAEPQTPRPASDGRSFDVMSWYRQWNGRAPDITTLTYRVALARHARNADGVRGLATPVLPLLDVTNWFRFAAWACGAIAVAFVDIIRGRWWHPLLLNEAALRQLATLVPQQALARDYLLNNSGWLYRPLWTYEAERRGSRILFYHYSANSASFKRADGYRPEHYTWPLTNWPIHLVWDDHHADFVRRAVGPATATEVVGPIWFASSGDDMTDLRASAIAVFDIQPFRASRVPALAIDFFYYTPETCTAFVRDVARACAETGHEMAWKRKRNIGKMAHSSYRRQAVEIDRQSHVVLLPSDLAAIRVIEHCTATISLPFTSTALFARQMGKPSCFYDPSGLIQTDDRAAHDIPVLTSYEGLVGWIRSLPDASPRPTFPATIG